MRSTPGAPGNFPGGSGSPTDVNLITINSSPISLGQTTMASSFPVVVASNQTAIPASQSGTWSITDISGTISLPTGAATAAKQDTGNTSLASIKTNSDNLDVLLSTRLKAADTLAGVTTVGTITNVVHVDDNSGSITIDQPTASNLNAVVWGWDGSSNRALSTNSSGHVNIADGGNSITVDGSVSITGSVDTELTTADLDTGAGTDTRAVVGLVLAASGGGLLVGSANPMPISDNSGSLTVDGTVAVTNSDLTTIAGAVRAEDSSSADAQTGIGALAIRKATPANTSNTDGDYEFLQMSAGRLWVSAVVDTALPAGTNAIGKLAANSGVTIGAVEIASSQTLSTVTTVGSISTSVTPGTSAAHLGKAEDVGHSSGDTGVFILGVRNDALSTQSNADLDYTQVTVDGQGRTVTQPFAPAAARAVGTATTTGTSDTSLVAASGSASLRFYLTSAQIVNTGSTTSLITFKDGNAGSTIGYTVAPTGGGSNIYFPIPLRTSTNTALYFAAASSSTTIYVSAQGYYAP